MKGTLKELDLRKVEPCSIAIAESSKDYVLSLTRTWDNVYYEFIGLYRVTTAAGIDVYVIAEDRAGALSQASCNEELNLENAVVVRLPLTVRGWGKSVFLGIEEKGTQ